MESYVYRIPKKTREIIQNNLLLTLEMIHTTYCKRQGMGNKQICDYRAFIPQFRNLQSL